jgi:tetratricopeptide (TPR) repeat protein
MTPRLAVTAGAALLSATIVCAQAVAPAAIVQQTPPASLAGVLAEARKLIDAGQPRVALEKLQTIEEHGNPFVEELLGVAYYHANDPSHAIEHLTASIARLAPGSLERREAAQVLGLSHYLAGHLVESIPYLEEVRPLVPDDIKLAYVLGMAYAQTRQADKARESFARTFHVAPGSAAAHLIAGQMMNRLELEDMAETELKAAVQTDPKLPEAHYLLGQIAIFRSRLDEGLALLREELAINPAHAMALYRIGDVYSRQLKWDLAIAALQQSLWINPYFSGPLILLGKAYSKTNQLEAAEDMLRRGIQVDPNNKSAHYLLAQLLQQTGRTDEAKREFAIAERLQGDLVK